MLFVIYINDLPSHLANVFKLDADDTKLLLEMFTEESASNFQRDLSLAFKYAQDRIIKFNINTLVVMYYEHNN